MTDGAAGSLTFVGTATTLIRLGGFTVLTDPNFLHRGQRAYLGKGLWSRRLTEPGMRVDEVPPVDAVVLSHLHGGHFDRVARRGLDRTPALLTTPAAAPKLRRWGFAAEGLPTWTARTLERDGERLTVRALPAVHAYGLMGRLLPPVMGSLLEHEAATGTRRVYVTGDTLTGDHLDEIRERCAPVDAVVAHLGGTRVLFHTVTMDARQGMRLLRQVPTRRVVPVHFDDYGVFRSPVSDFVSLLQGSDLATEVAVPERGRTVDLW